MRLLLLVLLLLLFVLVLVLVFALLLLGDLLIKARRYCVFFLVLFLSLIHI